MSDQNITLASDIVAAYVRRQPLPATELPGLINTVHAALEGLGRPKEPAKRLAAEVRRSIDGDRLVSFIDGKRYGSLTRHLRGHGLTPEVYRTRFGLPADYPMIAPGYAARRSELAKASGLGQQRRTWPAKA